ncbi:hypothetical protein ACYOEI_32970, partial [Singulisphaera rosea]
MIPFVEPVSEPTDFVAPPTFEDVDSPVETSEVVFVETEVSVALEPEVVLEAQFDPEVILEAEVSSEPEIVVEGVLTSEPVVEDGVGVELEFGDETSASPAVEDEVDTEVVVEATIVTSVDDVTIEPAPAANRPAKELRPPIVIELPPQSHRLTSDSASIPDDLEAKASLKTGKVDPSSRVDTQRSASASSKAEPDTATRRDRGLYYTDPRTSTTRESTRSKSSSFDTGTSSHGRNGTEAPSSRRNGRKPTPTPTPLEGEPRRSSAPNSKLAPDLLAPPSRKLEDAKPEARTSEESAREWPRASDIFAAHQTVSARVAPTRPSARKPLTEPTPTESREPASWRLPLWLSWFPMVVATLGVGTLGFVASRAWTRDA